jgi:hypothetical protein
MWKYGKTIRLSTPMLSSPGPDLGPKSSSLHRFASPTNWRYAGLMTHTSLLHPPLIALAAPLALLLASCATTPTATADPVANPQAAFMARLNALCGKSFAGRITGSEPTGADDDMAGQPLIMHVRGCTADRVEIPFHVGNDHSRTWIITRTAVGLRLKHDHRHEDGTSDAVTMYGGNTVTTGSATRQDFPIDEESIATFRANGLNRSLTNVWAVEVSPSADAAPRFTYELTRPAGPNARLFRVEFDLSHEVPTPPTPWGW